MVSPGWLAALALGLVLGIFPTKWYYQRDKAAQLADVAKGMSATIEAYRAQEHELQASVENIRQEARENEQTTRDNAYAAGIVAGSLHNAGAATASKARCPTSGTAGSQTTNAAANLLADVLARLDEAAGAIAQAADERAVAGDSCWRTLELNR